MSTVRMTTSEINRMRVADLRGELESRGLETVGVKSALVKRLTEEVECEDLAPCAAS